MITITGTSGDDTLSAYAPTNGFSATTEFASTIESIASTGSGFVFIPTYRYAGQLYAVSHSGDMLAFTLFGDNSSFVPGEVNTGTDFYLLDRGSNSLELASSRNDGTQSDLRFEVSIPKFSPNDNYLAFTGWNTLFDNDDANISGDLYLKNLITGELLRVNESASGVQGDGNAGLFFWIDNETLFLESSSTNLVDGQTFANGAFYEINFVTGEVNAVMAGGSSLADQVIFLPRTGGKLAQLSRSENGLIAFTSDQDFNGAPNDGLNDVYVYNPETDQYFRASTDSNGNSADPLQSFDSDGSYFPSISPDGTLVAFKSGAGNFVSNDFNQNPDIFVKNLQTGETIRISVPNEGGEIDDFYQLTAPKFSPDGTMVMFGAAESILGNSEELQGIYIWTVATGQIERIEVPTSNGLVIPQPHGGTSLDGGDSRGLDWLPDSSGILYTADNSLAEILFTSDISLGATINGLGGNDRITGTRNADTLDGGTGDDELFGGLGNDTLNGGDQNDKLQGGGGDDLLNGGNGDDTLEGGTGTNTLIGGAGSDTFFIKARAGAHTITDFGASDALDVSEFSQADLETFYASRVFDEAAQELQFSLTLANGEVISLAFSSASADLVSRKAFGLDVGINEVGTSGDDVMLGTDFNDQLDGLGGNDTIDGGAGSDVIFGGTGADDVLGGRGADVIFGGDQNDVLRGGNGNDQVLGQRGADFLYGGNGNDLLLGGNRNDRLFGEDGNDRVFGGNDQDTVSGGDGNDIVRGGNGDDVLNGDVGNDVMFGGTGRDWVDGGEGDDVLFGRGGFDVLNGGAGNDMLEGGVQADQFVFEDGFGNDTIADFASLNDAENIILTDVTEITDFDDLVANHMSQVGANVVIADGFGNTITLLGVNLGDLDAADFVF